MPLFYRYDSVIASKNSQFAARSAFHLVKWVLAAARTPRAPGRKAQWPVFIDVAAHDGRRAHRSNPPPRLIQSNAAHPARAVFLGAVARHALGSVQPKQVSIYKR